jgi:hypothetical protein
LQIDKNDRKNGDGKNQAAADDVLSGHGCLLDRTYASAQVQAQSSRSTVRSGCVLRLVVLSLNEAIDRIRHLLGLVEGGEVAGICDPFDRSVFGP